MGTVMAGSDEELVWRRCSAGSLACNPSAVETGPYGAYEVGVVAHHVGDRSVGMVLAVVFTARADTPPVLFNLVGDALQDLRGLVEDTGRDGGKVALQLRDGRSDFADQVDGVLRGTRVAVGGGMLCGLGQGCQGGGR